MNRRTAFVIVVAVALGATGCGGGDDPTVEAPSETSTTPPPGQPPSDGPGMSPPPLPPTSGT